MPQKQYFQKSNKNLVFSRLHTSSPLPCRDFSAYRVTSWWIRVYRLHVRALWAIPSKTNWCKAVKLILSRKQGYVFGSEVGSSDWDQRNRYYVSQLHARDAWVVSTYKRSSIDTNVLNKLDRVDLVECFSLDKNVCLRSPNKIQIRKMEIIGRREKFSFEFMGRTQEIVRLLLNILPAPQPST